MTRKQRGGALSAKDRRRRRAAVERRDGTGCHWCGTPAAETLDHVIPRSAGGSNRIENLVLACHNCNEDRGGFHGIGSYTPGAPTRRIRGRRD